MAAPTAVAFSDLGESSPKVDHAKQAETAELQAGSLSHASTSSSTAASAEEALAEVGIRTVSNSTSGSFNSRGDSCGFQADYTLSDRVLGAGASCSVMEATCRRTAKKVAVKSFKKLGMTNRAWEGVERECAVHHSVSHQNILKVENVYHEGSDEVHIVTERLAGGELFDRVLQKQGLPEAEAAGIAVQLLRAVGYLHSRKITHRDIKPENIMYQEQGGELIKLIDFGFATHWEDGARLTQRCGTLQYTAPEVLSEAGYTWKADMWSLGGVVYTTLVARLLYAGSNQDVARKNRDGKIDYSRNFSRVSWLAQDFVKSLLSVDERRRPAVLEALMHPWLRRHVPEQAEAARQEVYAEFTAQQDQSPARGQQRISGQMTRGVGESTTPCCCFAAFLPSSRRHPQRKKSAYMHSTPANIESSEEGSPFGR